MDAYCEFLESYETILVGVIDFEHLVEDDIGSYFQIWNTFTISLSIDSCT